MDFVKLTLDRIGQGSEAGSVVEEFYDELKRLGAQVLDADHYGKSGKITLTLAVERNGDDALLITPSVKISPPERKRKSAVGYLNNSTGEIMTQNAQQLPLPHTSRRPARQEDTQE